MPRAGNGTLTSIIRRCHACREACEDYIAQLDLSTASRAAVAPVLRCVAFLSVIADTLEANADISPEVIGAAIEMAQDLPDDGAGCAEACRAAADALSEWHDGSYEHT